MLIYYSENLLFSLSYAKIPHRSAGFLPASFLSMQVGKGEHFGCHRKTSQQKGKSANFLSKFVDSVGLSLRNRFSTFLVGPGMILPDSDKPVQR